MFRVTSLISVSLCAVQASEPDATAMLQTATKRDLQTDGKLDDVFDVALDGIAGLDNDVKNALVQRMTSADGWAGLVDKFKTLPQATKMELLKTGATLPELKDLLTPADVALLQGSKAIEESTQEKNGGGGSTESSTGGKNSKPSCSSKYKKKFDKVEYPQSQRSGLCSKCKKGVHTSNGGSCKAGNPKACAFPNVTYCIDAAMEAYDFEQNPPPAPPAPPGPPGTENFPGVQVCDFDEFDQDKVNTIAPNQMAKDSLCMNCWAGSADGLCGENTDGNNCLHASIQDCLDTMINADEIGEGEMPDLSGR